MGRKTREVDAGVKTISNAAAMRFWPKATSLDKRFSPFDNRRTKALECWHGRAFRSSYEGLKLHEREQNAVGQNAL